MLYFVMGKKKHPSRHLIIGLVITGVCIISLTFLILLMPRKDSCVVFDGEAGKQCPSDYLGLSEESASDKARQNGLIIITNPHESVAARPAGPAVEFGVKNGIVTTVRFQK